MKKININIANLNSNKYKSKDKKKTLELNLKINPKYFNIALIPYNKILKNILLFLQKNLPKSMFNETYKFFIYEIKKYINTSSLNNIISTGKASNKSTKINANNNLIGRNLSILSDYSLNNCKIGIKKLVNAKTNFKKIVKPMVGLSYIPKFNLIKSKKNIYTSSFSNANCNCLDLNFNKDISSKYNKINFFNKNININKTLSSNNSLSQEKDISYVFNNNNTINTQLFKNKSYIPNSKEANNNIKKKKKIILYNNINKFKMNVKLSNKKISLKAINTDYNTINTSIHKKNKINNKIKKIINCSEINKGNNSYNLSSNTKKKIGINRTLANIPHQIYPDMINKSSNRNTTDGNGKIKNAVAINNSYCNKYKNNFGLIQNNQKKLKIIKIQLQNIKNNGGLSVFKPIMNSEEMLKKIKNSLDDDNLKVMLNFSYENFLSKESERESKEYSIED